GKRRQGRDQIKFQPALQRESPGRRDGVGGDCLPTIRERGGLSVTDQSRRGRQIAGVSGGGGSAGKGGAILHRTSPGGALIVHVHEVENEAADFLLELFDGPAGSDGAIADNGMGESPVGGGGYQAEN